MKKYLLVFISFGVGLHGFSQGVGINVSSPVNMLDVEGAVAIGSSYSGTSTADANGAIIEGNVGIGTSNPSVRLDVRSSSASVARFDQTATSGADASIEIVGSRNGSTTSNVAYIDLSDYDSDEGGGTEFTMARISGGMDDVSGQTGYLRFYTNSGASLTEKVRIDKQGDVGIGTSDPSQALQVIGNIQLGETGDGQWVGASSFYNLKVDISNPWYAALNSGGNAYINADSDGGGGNNDIIFGHSRTVNTGGTTNVTFKGSGEVGIGSTTPTGKLEVEGSSENELVLDAAAGSPDIMFAENESNKAQLLYNIASNRFDLRIDDAGGVTSGDEVFTVLSSGNVGIGSTVPLQKLDVAGDVTFQDDGKIGFNNDLSGQARSLKLRSTYTGDQADAGTIAYRPTWDTNVLGIVGAGTGANREIRMWDLVGINKNPVSTLDVGGKTTTQTFQVTTGAVANYVLQSDGSGNATWVDPDGLANLITGVTAGNGLTGDATAGTASLDVVARNGITANANDIELGGSLDQATTITHGANVFTHSVNSTANMIINLSSSGDFEIQDAGTAVFTVRDNGNVGIGTDAPTRGLDINDDLRVRGTTFTPVDGNNNNVPLGGKIRLSLQPGSVTADFNITGISGGTNGHLLMLYNETGYNCTFINQSGLSLEANKMGSGGANIVIPHKRWVWLMYEGKWRPMASD